MSRIVSTTSPNELGEMFWMVHYKSSRYDNDSRWPTTDPVDSRSYVLAKTREEAIKKAEPDIKKARQQSDKGAGEEIVASIVTLESLVPARNSADDGRLGWTSNSRLSVVQLTSQSDTKRYRLAVCLVPVEE